MGFMPSVLAFYVISIIISASAQLKLKVNGLPENSCIVDDNQNLTSTCNYNYNVTRVGTKVDLECVFSGTVYPKAVYNFKFGNDTKRVIINPEELFTETLSETFTLTAESKTIECEALRNSGWNSFTVLIHFNYIAPVEVTSTKPTIATTIEPNTSVKQTFPWSFWLAVSIIIVLLAALIWTTLKCKNTAKKLKKKENEIDEREKEISKLLAFRTPITQSPEAIYEDLRPINKNETEIGRKKDTKKDNKKKLPRPPIAEPLNDAEELNTKKMPAHRQPPPSFMAPDKTRYVTRPINKNETEIGRKKDTKKDNKKKLPRPPIAEPLHDDLEEEADAYYINTASIY